MSIRKFIPAPLPCSPPRRGVYEIIYMHRRAHASIVTARLCEAAAPLAGGDVALIPLKRRGLLLVFRASFKWP